MVEDGQAIPVIPPDVTTAIAECDYIVGSDECGYGSWAGPLVVCAVAVSKDWPLAHLVKDSKAFTGPNAGPHRERVAKQILKSLTYAIVSVHPPEIDERGVGKVLPASHGKAIDAVIDKHKSMGIIGTNAVIVDGNLKVFYGEGKTARSLPKADSLIPAVSAASILAKVARDAHMVKMSVKYPGYGFEKHLGYGGDATHQHTIALKKLGISEIHRKSYAPMRDMIRQQQPDFDLSVFEAK